MLTLDPSCDVEIWEEDLGLSEYSKLSEIEREEGSVTVMKRSTLLRKRVLREKILFPKCLRS